MFNRQNIDNVIDERDIHRSKCLLNAAIPASLNGNHPADIHSVKTVVFDILDCEDPVYDGIKGVLIEGDLFDAAQMLEFKARKMPDRAGVLYTQAAVLFAPLMNVKSIMAFEQAQKYEAYLGPYHAMMARLYDRMGDPKASQIQRKLAEEFDKNNPNWAHSPNESMSGESATDNVTYLSFRS